MESHLNPPTAATARSSRSNQSPSPSPSHSAASAATTSSHHHRHTRKLATTDSISARADDSDSDAAAITTTPAADDDDDDNSMRIFTAARLGDSSLGRSSKLSKVDAGGGGGVKVEASDAKESVAIAETVSGTVKDENGSVKSIFTENIQTSGAYSAREDALRHEAYYDLENSANQRCQSEETGKLSFACISNDGSDGHMIWLIGLKNIFARQLPNMPKEYIVRLVMDRNHKSVMVIRRNTVVGGITYRPYKRLMISASVNERKVNADTARVVAEKSKGCKRKDGLMKLVMEGLMAIGYDVAICKSKWDKSPSFPAGEYDYIDVIVGGERLIIDVDFRSEFEVAKSTKTYKSILQILPNIFVGKSDRLSKIICIVSEAAKQSLKKKGMPIPPWRKSDYFRAKWLSPVTRIANTSVVVSAGPTPDSQASNLAAVLPAVLPVTSHSDEHEASCRSSQTGTVSNMSERSEEDIAKLKGVSFRPSQPETVFDTPESCEENVKFKFKVNGDLFLIRPKKNKKIVSGLSSIMEDQP